MESQGVEGWESRVRYKGDWLGIRGWQAAKLARTHLRSPCAPRGEVWGEELGVRIKGWGVRIKRLEKKVLGLITSRFLA